MAMAVETEAQMGVLIPCISGRLSHVVHLFYSICETLFSHLVCLFFSWYAVCGRLLIVKCS